MKAAIDALGPDWILYESDFPHPTSMAPGPASAAVEPRQYIADTLGDLPEHVLRKILHDNAAAAVSHGLTPSSAGRRKHTRRRRPRIAHGPAPRRSLYHPQGQTPVCSPVELTNPRASPRLFGMGVGRRAVRGRTVRGARGARVRVGAGSCHRCGVGGLAGWAVMGAVRPVPRAPDGADQRPPVWRVISSDKTPSVVVGCHVYGDHRHRSRGTTMRRWLSIAGP